MPKPFIIASLILTIIVPKASAALIQFGSFADLSPMALNGSSKIQNTKLRLTDAENQTGSAFYPEPIPVDQAHGFSTWFQFQITGMEGAGSGTDGLAFVMQSIGSNVVGKGGGIGYAGITPSIAVEFDTFHNQWDPNGNHTGVNINGSVVSQASYYIPIPFDNGHLWNAWIDLNASNDSLEIAASTGSVRPSIPQFTYLLTLSEIFNPSDNIFVGFTAATGSPAVCFDVLAWHFNCEPNPVPLPSTMWMFLSGILGLILKGRKDSKI